MDISDMRDRMLDIEQNFKKSNRANDGVLDRIDKVENDVNNILGRSEASNATGTPSIVSQPTKSLKNGRIRIFISLII